MMTTDSLIGQHLDEYRLDTLLGQGGMARVYRALDVRLKRWVAIKVIDRPFRTDLDYGMRFEREAQAIAQLEYPHIVRLYRYGEANGLLYMAMQYIEGADLDFVLASYREEGGFIEPAEAGRIIREICLALDYAHSKGVIHRDVKPSNIMLDKTGHAILTDFGLALLSEVGTRGEIFGSPHYIAPEQIVSSAKVVPQSDLYAVGVILYEMFTGQLPFDHPEPMEVAMLHMVEPPRPPREVRPEISPELEAVILKALAKESSGRYSTGAALAEALDQALQPSSKTALPAPTLSRVSIPERVAVELAEHPVPSLPAVVTPPAQQVESSPTGEPVASLPSTAPTSLRSFIFLGLGIGLVLSLGLMLVVLLGLFLWLRVGNEGAANPSTPVAATPGPIEGPATPVISADSSLTQTPTPLPPSPTPSPLPEPQLITDSAEDFSNAPGIWEYLVFKPNENRFEGMSFEQRKYGQCWYGQDYIRICPDSGHPGNSADIVWRWTSQSDGRVQVQLWAHKIDRGGDGVTIRAYHNGQEVQGQRIGGQDTEGVAQKNWFDLEVKVGDTLQFVMQKNGNAQNDHTFFLVQIYQQ